MQAGGVNFNVPFSHNSWDKFSFVNPAFHKCKKILETAPSLSGRVQDIADAMPRDMFGRVDVIELDRLIQGDAALDNDLTSFVDKVFNKTVPMSAPTFPKGVSFYDVDRDGPMIIDVGCGPNFQGSANFKGYDPMHYVGPSDRCNRVTPQEWSALSVDEGVTKVSKNALQLVPPHDLPKGFGFHVVPNLRKWEESGLSRSVGPDQYVTSVVSSGIVGDTVEHDHTDSASLSSTFGLFTLLWFIPPNLEIALHFLSDCRTTISQMLPSYIKPGTISDLEHGGSWRHKIDGVLHHLYINKGMAYFGIRQDERGPGFCTSSAPHGLSAHVLFEYYDGIMYIVYAKMQGVKFLATNEHLASFLRKIRFKVNYLGKQLVIRTPAAFNGKHDGAIVVRPDGICHYYKHDNKRDIDVDAQTYVCLAKIMRDLGSPMTPDMTMSSLDWNGVGRLRIVKHMVSGVFDKSYDVKWKCYRHDKRHSDSVEKCKKIILQPDSIYVWNTLPKM